MTAEEYIRENYGERWLTPSAEWTPGDVIAAMEEYASQSLPGEEEIKEMALKYANEAIYASNFPHHFNSCCEGYTNGFKACLSRLLNNSEQPVNNPYKSEQSGKTEQLKGFDEEKTKGEY